LQRLADGDLGRRWRRGGRLLVAAPDLLPADGRHNRQDSEDR
jgi:hypothetical protein